MECTLREFFQEHYEAYAERRRLPLYVHRAAYWIAHCRTAELGGHVRRCPAGHVERAFYNSCHQRGCPQCQAMATEAWLERQRARLLACAHHHLIFTIPHELNALWRWNRATMAQLLFDAVRAVLIELLGDPRYLGAKPAFLSALHTWGRSLSLHPHVHALAADGGLDENGVWVRPRRSHFLPARVLMLLFRGKLLAALREVTSTALPLSSTPCTAKTFMARSIPTVIMPMDFPFRSFDEMCKFHHGTRCRSRLPPQPRDGEVPFIR